MGVNQILTSRQGKEATVAEEKLICRRVLEPPPNCMKSWPWASHAMTEPTYNGGTLEIQRQLLWLIQRQTQLMAILPTLRAR